MRPSGYPLPLQDTDFYPVITTFLYSLCPNWKSGVDLEGWRYYFDLTEANPITNKFLRVPECITRVNVAKCVDAIVATIEQQEAGNYSTANCMALCAVMLRHRMRTTNPLPSGLEHVRMVISKLLYHQPTLQKQFEELKSALDKTAVADQREIETIYNALMQEWFATDIHNLLLTPSRSDAMWTMAKIVAERRALEMSDLSALTPKLVESYKEALWAVESGNAKISTILNKVRASTGMSHAWVPMTPPSTAEELVTLTLNNLSQVST